MEKFLEESGFVSAYGGLNAIYDETGFLYEIPNYCIHWPDEYAENKVSKPEAKDLKIKFQHLGTNTIASFSNYVTAEMVKDHLAKEYKVNSSMKIRLFYKGRELINSHEIWEYQIEDEHTVTVMIKT